jgi:hypothetical protein
MTAWAPIWNFLSLVNRRSGKVRLVADDSVSLPKQCSINCTTHRIDAVHGARYIYDTSQFVLDQWRSCTPGKLIGSDVVSWYQRNAAQKALTHVGRVCQLSIQQM